MLSLIYQLAGRPWAVRADLAAHVHGLLRREGGTASLRHFARLKGAIHAFDEGDDDRPRAARRGMRAGVAGTVAVIPMVGVVTQRGDIIDSVETRSTAEVADEVTAAAAEPKVDAIVLEIDSPGGEVYGVPEAWAVVRAAAQLKPVVAIANSQMASAALYVGSAATELWVTPSGEVGSVGVYALHVDVTKAMEDLGEKTEFIVADDSPYKVEGNAYEPLSDDARAEIKRSVNRYMAMFVRDLAKGRKVTPRHVQQHFGKGRMLGPQEAVAAKMVDQVGTLDQAIRRAAQLAREPREGGRADRALAMERARGLYAGGAISGRELVAEIYKINAIHDTENLPAEDVAPDDPVIPAAEDAAARAVRAALILRRMAL